MRKNTSMEDSTAMTIEFLRARLLSERSVSRTAKQRAEELAKRVMELEKRLKTVSLQRKKAEKATADVLAILESHGRSDVSETFDSNSDQEAVLVDSKLGISSVKGEETSGNVKVGENDVEAFSGSESESSSLNGRSLSWKSSKDSLPSLEKKYLDASRRRRSGFASSGSSSPKRVGKSCRQIRRREHRLAVSELQTDASTNVHHEDEVTKISEGVHNCSDIGPETSREGAENREEKDLPGVPISVILENHRISNAHYLNHHGGDKDMERALEHQAQLIGRYEAEEKAQREWEDKFRENNASTSDSCDPGNHSDVTEERDEIKAPAPPCSSGLINPHNQEAEVGLESKTPSGFQRSPHFNMESLQDQKCNGVTFSKSPASESEVFVAKEKHDEEFSYNQHYPQLHGSHHNPNLHGTSENNLAHVSSSESNSLHKGEAPGKTNEFALMPVHANFEKVGSVLEALQQAKLSLNQNLNRFPLLEGGSILRDIEPSVPAARSGDRFAIPVTSSGLFRLPTDFLHGSDSRLRMANYSPDPTGAKFFSSPYIESRSSTSSIDDRFLTVPTFPYLEIRSGVPTRPSIFEPAGLPSSGNRYIGFDSHLNAGLPSSSRYTHTTYPSYPELMPRMPSDGRVPSFVPTTDVGIPPPTRFSFHDDYTRPNMYR